MGITLAISYWSLQHNWEMHYVFMFNGRQGIQAYLRKLNGLSNWGGHTS